MAGAEGRSALRSARGVADARTGAASDGHAPDGPRPDGIVFSYAEPSDPLPKRAVIRAVEAATGQMRLRRIYIDNRLNGRPGESFWRAAVRRLGLRLVYDEARLGAVPRTGPLVIIANHPYGVIDGLSLGCLMEAVRPDFKVMANGLFTRAREIKEQILPVDFADHPDALATNIRSRAAAGRHLAAGGAVAIFPAGAISWARTTFGTAVDRPWKPFTAKLIRKHKADVLPLFFEGQNSALFHFASRVSFTLRSSLHFREVVRRMGTELHVRVGAVIPHADIASMDDRGALMDHLRRVTYGLGGLPHLPAAEPAEIAFFGRRHLTPAAARRHARAAAKA